MIEHLASGLVRSLKEEEEESAVVVVVDPGTVLRLLLPKVFPGHHRKPLLGLLLTLPCDRILDRTLDLLFQQLLQSGEEKKCFSRNMMQIVASCGLMEKETKTAFQARCILAFVMTKDSNYIV